MTTVSTSNPPASTPSNTEVTVVKAHRGWVAVNFAEVWRYRELLFFLALRDIKVRYKQTVLGAAWAMLQPLMVMVVFSVLFGLLMDRKPTIAGIPYGISTFCALVPWQLFAASLSQAGNSLVNNRHLITKVYFPRLLTPSAPVLAAGVDFVIAFGVLILMIAGYHFFDSSYQFQFSWGLLLLPVFTLTAAMTALGAALWLSALNALYRDFRYTITFLVQLWMYATPVVYTAGSIHEKLNPKHADLIMTIYSVNPMVGVVEGFRWAMLGTDAPQPGIFVVSFCVMAFTLWSGMYYFKRMERHFADLV
ncbi:MAG: phosphate ABC transporter permease [Planctomycetaceae bacterium]|nr:phosphate ABC transporter permease [Planctomycetaceae bacterium]